MRSFFVLFLAVLALGEFSIFDFKSLYCVWFLIATFRIKEKRERERLSWRRKGPFREIASNCRFFLRVQEKEIESLRLLRSPFSRRESIPRLFCLFQNALRTLARKEKSLDKASECLISHLKKLKKKLEKKYIQQQTSRALLLKFLCRRRPRVHLRWGFRLRARGLGRRLGQWSH